MKANFIHAPFRAHNTICKYTSSLLSPSALGRYAVIAIFSRGVAVAAERPVVVTSPAIPPAPRDLAAVAATVSRLQKLKQRHRRFLAAPPTEDSIDYPSN